MPGNCPALDLLLDRLGGKGVVTCQQLSGDLLLFPVLLTIIIPGLVPELEKSRP